MEPQFSRDDFLSTIKPYEYLRQLKKDPLRHEKALLEVQENARSVGIRNFRKMYKFYLRDYSLRASVIDKSR